MKGECNHNWNFIKLYTTIVNSSSLIETVVYQCSKCGETKELELK